MATAKVDRQTQTPFLLRLFYKSGNFHRNEEFSTSNPSLPPHLQIYTWLSCTLSELTHLLTTALPDLIPAPAIGTRLTFRLAFPDTRDTPRPGQAGRWTIKDLGSVVVGAGGPGASLRESNDNDDEDSNITAAAAARRRRMLERLEGDADKTLADARFVIGDYVTVSIFPPLPNGDVASGPNTRPPPGGATGLRDFSMGRPAAPARGENGFGRSRGGRYDGGGSGGGRYDGGGGVPPGEWRRGDVPPGRDGGGGGGGFGRREGRGGRGAY